MSRFPSGKERDRQRRDGLRDFILARIRQSGLVPFSRFMEWCLYHPDFGYYHSEGAV